MKILIIEDDISLVDTLKDVLESESYLVDYYINLEEIDDYIILNSYDLVILDLMLGKYNGLDFLNLVRKEIQTPIIILTAKNTKDDIIKGFGLGVDDYITKSFDMDILLARIKARIGGEEKIIRYKKTYFDFDRLLVKKEKETIELTSKEVRILAYLYKNKGIFISKDKILMNINKDLGVSARVVVSHIYNIRQKLLSIGQMIL